MCVAILTFIVGVGFRLAAQDSGIPTDDRDADGLVDVLDECDDEAPVWDVDGDGCDDADELQDLLDIAEHLLAEEETAPAELEPPGGGGGSGGGGSGGGR